MEKENKKNNIWDIIVKIVLIVIIIILLLHNCSMIKNLNKDKKASDIPVGNIDVFELKCDEKKCQEVLPDQKEIIKPDDDNNSNNNNKNNNNNNKPSSDDKKSDDSKPDKKPDDKTEPETDPEGELVVSDTATWESQNELRIFANPLFEMDNKIAPESSNVYEFIIRNNTNLTVNYNMKFIETNEKNINMKYRLKRGNEYVVGSSTEWVTAEELDLSNIILDSNKDHIYYLEWKWFSSDNDTQIGADANVKYKLNILINAEGTNA